MGKSFQALDTEFDIGSLQAASVGKCCLGIEIETPRAVIGIGPAQGKAWREPECGVEFDQVLVNIVQHGAACIKRHVGIERSYVWSDLDVQSAVGRDRGVLGRGEKA